MADLAHQDRELRRPHRLPGEVVRVLETAIIYCEIDPGARLIEEEVGLRYGVSRSPVREAFRLLEHDGLIVRGAKGGVRVAGLSRADLDEVYACRVALESLAAEEAAAAHGKSDLAVLRRTYREMERAHGDGDVRSYFQLNVALTKAIHAATGNQSLMRLLSMIDKQAQRYRYMAYVKSPHLIDLSLEGNKEILEAIATGQRKPAREMTARLIRRSWQAIATHFDKEAQL